MFYCFNDESQGCISVPSVTRRDVIYSVVQCKLPKL